MVRMAESDPTPHREPVIERLPLEHPLPAEIQTMARDDTVCKFCGISYFIHHEVKALEEKVKTLEKDLMHYQETLEREKNLKDKVANLQKIQIQNQQSIQNTQEEVCRLENVVSKHTNEIQKLNDVKGQLQDKLHSEMTHNAILRKQNNNIMSQLPEFMIIAKKQRSELANVHTTVSQMSKLVDETMVTLNAKVTAVCGIEMAGQKSLKSKLLSLEDKLQRKEEEYYQLESSGQNDKTKLKQMEDLEMQLQISNNNCEEIRGQIHTLQNDLDDAAQMNRVAGSEAGQMKEQLNNKTLELQNFHAQQRKKDTVSEQLLRKYQNVLKEKSEELRLANVEIRKTEHRMSEQNRIEEEIKRQAEVTMLETEGVKDFLCKANEECKALKAERELMIISHQNRIEQLRESFKQKLNQADKWPEKMSDELRKQKSRHADEVKSLEECLKNAFQMEMEIEKQKHGEMLGKYTSELKNRNEKTRNELKSVQLKHKAELALLERQMTEAKNSVSNVEASLREELSGFKCIITNLQDKLAGVDRENDETVLQLKAELREAENDLISGKEECQKMEEKLSETKEEILFLQDTVRRECEERFDLTEALSQAREQLLSYHQRATAYSGSKPEPRPRLNSRPLSASRHHNNGLSLDKNTPDGSQLPQNSSTSVSSSGTSSVNIDFNCSDVNSSKVRGGSMKDSRQRIAAAIGRR